MSEKKKKLGFKLILISMLLLPGLQVLFIIGYNSNYLIRFPFYVLIFVMIFIFTILLIYGIILFEKNKDANKRKLRKWIKIVLGLFMTFYIIGCVAFVVLLYGPNEKFKSWLITTAMATMNHQYYCKYFYNETEINSILSKNYTKDSGEDTDTSLIKEKEKIPKYIDEYDKEILDVPEGTPYKIIKFEVNGEDAYLAAIYDPSKVKLQVTNYLWQRGEYVTKFAEYANALLAINGGGFYDNGASLGGEPNGITIKDGEVITDANGGRSSIIGFTNDNILVLLQSVTAEQAIEMGIRDCVSFSPFLIINGKPSEVGGNGGLGSGARTVIGQRADGIVLFLVVDSNEYRTTGAKMPDLIDIMLRYHAINAANLDGGTSSVMALPREKAINEWKAPCTDYFTQKYCAINDPIDSLHIHRTRYVADAWVVVE